MKLLHHLYFIHSPSGQEDGMSRFLQKHLKKIGITDFDVLGNQIYRIKEGTPLICVHMDQVQKCRSEPVVISSVSRHRRHVDFLLGKRAH